jgi:5'-nucleotidase
MNEMPKKELLMRSYTRKILPAILQTFALLLLSVASAAAQNDNFNSQFTIFQLNDVYRLDAVADGKAGGMSRVATLIKQTKGPVFLLHAGDFLAPSLESKFFAGQQMIAALNYLHGLAPVSLVPGNHEFDERQPQMLMDAISASQFPWLAANLQLRTPVAEVNRKISPHVLTLMGKTKVGIFALTIHGQQGGKDRDYAPVEADYLTVAEREIQALENEGAELIVGLTHLTITDDRQIARLRRNHPKFMWIAGGHEHFSQKEDLTPVSALITKGDSNARSVWRVRFGYQNGQAYLIPEKIDVDARIPFDKDYQREIADRFRRELEQKVPFITAQIGASSTRLEGLEEIVRTRESNWGSYLADQMRNAFGALRADIAVLNGGAIRIDDDFSGAIRFEHLWRTFGFATRVGYVWLRGKDVRQEILEHSVAAEPGDGRFLQVSGLKFEFDRHAAPGRRVRAVKVQQGEDWSALNDDQLYIVAVPDYLLEGGDGYNFKQKAVMTIPPGPELKLLTFEAISQAYTRGESISPAVEGRIVEMK